MADVGRAARVSAQTVSRYFTGTGYVSTETRARIKAAIDELGYRPNSAARTLRSNRTGTIGVLTIGPLYYGGATIITGLADAALGARFPLVISHLGIDMNDPRLRTEMHRALDAFLSARVDGLIVSTPFLGTEDLLDHIWETMPMVTISGRPRDSTDTVDIDSHAAGLLATRHLIEQGHRRIQHIAGPADRNEAYERTRGYLDALAEAGLEPLPIARGDWSSDSGHALGLTLDPADFTAVFAGNDEMALGFMAALRRRGRVAPDDYSIVGVDDMPDARWIDPPLSSLFMDFSALGREAFHMVLRRMNTGERQPRLVIAPVLVARESVRHLAPPLARDAAN